MSAPSVAMVEMAVQTALSYDHRSTLDNFRWLLKERSERLLNRLDVQMQIEHRPVAMEQVTAALADELSHLAAGLSAYLRGQALGVAEPVAEART